MTIIIFLTLLVTIMCLSMTDAFPFMPVPSRVPGYRLPIVLMGSGSSSSSNKLAEKVLERPQFPDQWPYSEQDFARMDESNDAVFYDSPRLVYHIDDAAVAALTKYYAENLKEGENVLDICSSWVSHYPKDFKGGKVVGLGMNEYELSQNGQLTEYVVKDLNADPALPFDDASFDKVTCVVSVDYLNKPLEIFKEIARVLRPGGECIISMSNRCFPTKAFQVRDDNNNNTLSFGHGRI
jgi:SAM-dependent methyltransferase